MKKTIYLSLVAFLIVMGCSKVNDVSVVNPDENQLKSGKIVSPILTASPIAPWGSPSIWDDNVGVLRTALWYPPSVGPAVPDYSFTQFPLYDFSPYYVHGATEYNPANYDVMTHFGYISPEAITGAVVEFTFRHIEYFLPHMNNKNQQRVYTVNNEDNEDSEGNDDREHYSGDETVITCTTDLVKGMNPMFCFLIKVDCEKEEKGEKERDHGKVKSRLTTFWTDMKVNGVSVKGTIKNKVFACN
jgi:hypothetical protein